MRNRGPQRQHKYFLFEVTKACHNDCVFCYNVWKEDDSYPEEELSTTDAISVLDRVIEASGCKHIALTGGEALLKEGVLEIASFITSKGVVPILITNGKLLDQATVERCMDSGIQYFEVSLHSDEQHIHDGLVGRGGSFEEAIDAIMNIVELGGHVNTVFVATSRNVRTFKGFVELNALLRVEWILFNRVACGGACLKDWTGLAPEPSEIQRALDEGVPVAEKYRIGLSAGVQVQPCLIDLSRYQHVLTNFCPLNNPTGEDSYFAIDPAGNLRMCNRSKLILGNLLERPLAELLEHPGIEEFCRAVPEFCRDCSLSGRCGGGCKADALSCYGTLDRADPYLETWKARAKKPSLSA